MNPFHSGMNHWQRQWLSDRLHKKQQTLPAAEFPIPAVNSKPKRPRQPKPKRKPAGEE
jgi:predicted alpha/beta hydrolase family esterase